MILLCQFGKKNITKVRFCCISQPRAQQNRTFIVYKKNEKKNTYLHNLDGEIKREES